jgi:AcrR family transcriptional regulator
MASGALSPIASTDERPGAGRPTRAQAQQRHEQLLDRALEMFLEKGYELTTIEAIAAAVGMTKRTVYARYEDKAALFRAAVQRAIERYIVPIETVRAAETDDLEETLIAIARMRLRNTLSPAGLRLQRILNNESYRFPEIHRLAYEQSARPTALFLTDLIERHVDNPAVHAADRELLGVSFLNFVVGGPVRGIVMGSSIDEEALEERVRYCVRLFLQGVLPR